MSSKRKTESKNEGPDSKVKKPSKLWTLGLVDSMNDPELQIKSDDLVVVIKDKFPKAKFHYLVLPKENINDLKKLKSEHVELLQHMEEMGREVVEDEKHSGSNFRFGFHARASMQRLHLHVISDDMVSPCLKNKKHWNTFTTDFFLNAESVRNSLEKNGKVELPSNDKIKEYMETPLACHRCNLNFKTIPALKKHIVDCIKKN